MKKIWGNCAEKKLSTCVSQNFISQINHIKANNLFICYQRFNTIFQNAAINCRITSSQLYMYKNIQRYWLSHFSKCSFLSSVYVSHHLYVSIIILIFEKELLITYVCKYGMWQNASLRIKMQAPFKLKIGK